MKFRLFWERNWFWIFISLVGFVSFVLPIWYLAGMEESVRRYIIGITLLGLPTTVFGTLLFVV
ncbi:MAG: hypothetical protein HY549_06850, partial [Elusimicrobia bacterium]|nr:hypothetical protein [Elusimicrobiota bacterium]